MPLIAMNRKWGRFGKDGRQRGSRELGLKVQHHEIVDHLANRARVARARHQLSSRNGRASSSGLTVDNLKLRILTADEIMSAAESKRGRDPAPVGATSLAQGSATARARLRVGIAPPAREAHDEPGRAQRAGPPSSASSTRTTRAAQAVMRLGTSYRCARYQRVRRRLQHRPHERRAMRREDRRHGALVAVRRDRRVSGKLRGRGDHASRARGAAHARLDLALLR